MTHVIKFSTATLAVIWIAVQLVPELRKEVLTMRPSAPGRICEDISRGYLAGSPLNMLHDLSHRSRVK